jgi:Ca-activated chloride channel family protein
MGILATAVIIIEVITWVVWLGAYWLLRTQVPAFRMERPWVLWAMFSGLLLVMLYLLNIAWKNRALARFAGTATLPRMAPGVSPSRSLFRFLFLRHGLSFVIVALSGPQFGTRMEEVKARGVDLVVAIDVSNSMLAEDLKPSRMEVARRAMDQLIGRLHGDRLGIVVFAGEAYVQLPITADRSAAGLFLTSVGPGMVPAQGTAIGAAIDLSRESFDAADATSKAIIIITDGESHEDDPESAARKAAEEGIAVHTIGMGTPQGAPIPLRQGAMITGFKKDKQGGTVVSKLNEDMLRRIATAGKGQYVRATTQDAGIQGIVDELRRMDQTEVGTFRYAGHEDRYRLFLSIGCALIFVALMIGERRVPRPKWMTLGDTTYTPADQ